MKILAVGGGSGGHVTPVVAVLREIKKIHPKSDIRFWCDGKFIVQAKEIMAHFDKSIPVHVISAGKFRRYHHMSILQHLLSPSIIFPNLWDGFRIGLGFWQSLWKLLIWRPDVVFTKGGYVCLPVGVAARLLRIPLVIHDSDAHPGLTNRILAKWATAIATGAPLEHYDYPKKISKYVGIPISDEFRVYSAQEMVEAKKQWNVSTEKPLIVITGGGLGAKRINDAAIKVLGDLMALGSVVLISGTGSYDELRSITPPDSIRFRLLSFVSHDIASLLGAADVVIARAGATTILELASLAKPTILIPNGQLTGGHQLKNAAVYSKKGAVIVIDEEEMVNDPQVLVSAVRDVFLAPGSAQKMAKSLASFSRPNAARDVAEMIVSSVKNR